MDCSFPRVAAQPRALVHSAFGAEKPTHSTGATGGGKSPNPKEAQAAKDALLRLGDSNAK
jgi:hypothetical protein